MSAVTLTASGHFDARAVSFTGRDATPAARPPVHGQELPTHSPDEADKKIAEMIAKSSGRSADVELKSLRAQDEFTRLATEVRERVPEYFSDARRTDDEHGEITLTADAPAEATKAAEQVANGRAVIKGGGKYSRADMDKYVEEIGQFFLDRGKTKRTFKVIPDAASGRIEVSGIDNLNAASVEWQGSPSSKAKAKVKPQVDVVQDPKIQGETAATVGGAQLNYSGLATGCTSGSPVRITDGPYGLSSADHCGGNLRYGNQPGLNSTPARQGGSQSLDLEVLTTVNQTSYPVIYRFQYEPHALRDVTWAARPVSGATYCRYGRTTFAHCDRIFSTGAGMYFESTLKYYNHLAETYPTTTPVQKGDSGGPAYSSSTAIGSITGYNSVFRQSYFTDIMEISTLGTSIYRKR